MHIYILRMHAFVLHNKTFSKTPTILLESIQKKLQWRNYKKITPSNPNWLEFWTLQGVWVHKDEKGPEITSPNMVNGRTISIEEIEKGQQEMQEKISQVTKMVTNLTKGKGITDDPGLQGGPTS